MNKMLMYDECDETYREVIDVKELREHILKRIEEYKKVGKIINQTMPYCGEYQRHFEIKALQSFLNDLEVEDD